MTAKRKHVPQHRQGRIVKENELKRQLQDFRSQNQKLRRENARLRREIEKMRARLDGEMWI